MQKVESYKAMFKLFPVSLGMVTALSIASYFLLPSVMLSGVILGGLLVSGNLVFFHLFLNKAMAPKSRMTIRKVLFQYYLLFALTVLIIFFLISVNLVHALGLILGLSSFILTIFFVMTREIGILFYRRSAKEAV